MLQAEGTADIIVLADSVHQALNAFDRLWQG